MSKSSVGIVMTTVVQCPVCKVYHLAQGNDMPPLTICTTCNRDKQIDICIDQT